MKPESFILSTAVLLTAVEESASDVLKSIHPDLRSLGVVPQFGAGTIEEIVCCIDGNELHIDVSDKSDDLEEVIESTVSLMASSGCEVRDDLAKLLRMCDVVVRFSAEDDSVFSIENGEGVVYIRPRLTTECQPFRVIVETIAERFHGLVCDIGTGTAYTTKSGFGPRSI